MIGEGIFLILPKVDLADYKKANHSDFSYLESSTYIKLFLNPKSTKYNNPNLYSCSM